MVTIVPLLTNNGSSPPFTFYPASSPRLPLPFPLLLPFSPDPYTPMPLPYSPIPIPLSSTPYPIP